MSFAFGHAEHMSMLQEFGRDNPQYREFDSCLTLLEVEVMKGNPSRIQESFELSIGLFPQYVKLWLLYLTWLDNGLRIPSTAVEAYKRAVSEELGSLDIMQLALIAYERAGESAESIDEVWEAAKKLIVDPDSGRSLYTTYIYLLKRRVVQSGSNDFTEVEHAFEEGYLNLRNSFQHWDPTFKYRLMYASFLYMTSKNFNKARDVVRDIMANGGSLQPRVVIEAVTYERHFGRDLTRCRQWLYQAVNSVFDENSHIIFEYLIQFEREEGNLDDLGKALAKVNSQAKRLLQREEQLKLQREEQLKKQRVNGTSNSQPKSTEKRKVKDDRPAVPKKKPAIRDKDGFVMPALPVGPRKAAVSAASSEPEPPAQQVEKSQVIPKKMNSMTDSNEKHEFQYSQGLEKNKLFVSNVNYNCGDEMLKEIFSQFGTVTGARIVTQKNGKSKGIAYVEYGSEDSAMKAVEAEQIVVMGRSVKVALSNPPPRKPFVAPVGKGAGMHRRIGSTIKASMSSHSGSSDPNDPADQQKPRMSNDEFRKFL